MIEPPSLRTLAGVAWSVWQMTPGEPDEAREALCWVVRNRIERLARARILTLAGRPQPAPFMAAVSLDDLLADFFSVQGQTAPPRDICTDAALVSEAEFLCALAALCGAFCGEGADPTEGAILFHNHTETPDWAAYCKPKALIGSRVYYQI